jgi:hypothetical protein
MYKLTFDYYDENNEMQRKQYGLLYHHEADDWIKYYTDHYDTLQITWEHTKDLLGENK